MGRQYSAEITPQWCVFSAPVRPGRSICGNILCIGILLLKRFVKNGLSYSQNKAFLRLLLVAATQQIPLLIDRRQLKRVRMGFEDTRRHWSQNKKVSLLMELKIRCSAYFLL